MPELPEVETIARGLARRVSGDVIASVWLGQKPEPLKSPAREIAAALEHSRIAAVRRMGKHIVFDLESVLAERAVPSAATGEGVSAKSRRTTKLQRGVAVRQPRLLSKIDAEADRSVRPIRTNATQAQWIVHLGMTGRLQVCEPQS